MAADSLKGGDEQRAEKRAGVAIPFEVVLLGVQGQPLHRVISTETSTGGMSFTSRRSFVLGEPLAIRFPFINGGKRLVLGIVRHCQACGAGSYRTGVEFIEAVTLTSTRLAIPSKWQAETEHFLRRRALENAPQ